MNDVTIAVVLTKIEHGNNFQLLGAELESHPQMKMGRKIRNHQQSSRAAEQQQPRTSNPKLMLG